MLIEDARMGANVRLTVDLQRQVVVRPNGEEIPFVIDTLQREMLLEGLDEIGQTMQRGPAIDAYESRVRQERSWTPVIAVD